MLGIKEETKQQKEEAERLGLETIDIISPDGTFLNPMIDDETEELGEPWRTLTKIQRIEGENRQEISGHYEQ